MLALLCSFPSMDWKESSAVDDGDDNDENGKRWRASEADLPGAGRIRRLSQNVY